MEKEKDKDKKIWLEREPAQLLRLLSETKKQSRTGHGMLLEIYRSIVESAGDSIYLVDRDCRYLFMNRSHLSRLGLSLKDVIGKFYGEFHTKKQGGEFKEKVEEAFTAGKPIQHEHQSERDHRYFLRTFSPVQDFSDGKVVGVTVVSKDITSLKQIEATIQESERRYRALFNYANDAVFIMRDDTFIDCNSLTLKMFGCTMEQIIGSPPYAFSPPVQPDGRDSKEKAFEKINLALSGQPQFFYWKHCRYDGTPFDAEVSLNSITIGDEVLIQALVRDITARKRAEDALRESEEKYRNILNSIEDGYHEVDIKGNFNFVSSSMARILGYSESELTGMNYRKYMDELDAKNVFKVYNEVYRTGIPSKHTGWEFIRKDGTRIAVEGSTSLIKSKDQASGFRGIIRDVTDKKKAEDALRESEEKYRIILSSIEDGYYEVNIKGTFTFVNSSMARILGYSESEMIGINYRKFADKVNAENVFKAYNEVYRTGIPSKHTGWEFIRKDGSKVDVESSVSLVKSNDQVIGFRGIIRDVTDKKKAEDALRMAYQDLQETKDQLIQQGRLAALGQLASGAAHEIRNPLNIMSLRLQMLEMQGTADQTVKKAIDVCKAQMNRIINIVEGLRDFSRAPVKKIERVDIKKTIENILTSWAPRFQDRGIATEALYAPDLPLMALDSHGVEQAISNLISNALDAMRNQDRKVLRVSAERGENNVRIILSDTGQGIKEDDMQKIFDPFFTTKGPDKGTGLGLYIAYGIIQDHGGSIRAENNEHGGATFIVELPIRDALIENG